MNFPADFPGNDVLSQMIAGWSGVSGNKTEPNGTSTFSFGDPNLPAPGTESPLTDDTMTTMATPSGGLTTSTQNVNAVSAGTSIAGSRHRRTRTTTTPLVVTETAVRSAITTTSGHSSTVSGSDAGKVKATVQIVYRPEKFAENAESVLVCLIDMTNIKDVLLILHVDFREFLSTYVYCEVAEK